MKENTSKVAILGMGSAGLLAAKHLVDKPALAGLSPSEICVVGHAKGGSSVLSSWYVSQYPPEPLAQRLIAGLGETTTQEQIELVKYIAYNHHEATESFAKDIIAHIGAGGVKRFVNGFSGIKALTGYSTVQALPGKKIMKYLREGIERCGVNVVLCTITDLRPSNTGFQVIGKGKNGEELTINAQKLVLSTGGLAHTQNLATSAKGDFPNVLALARDRLGIDVEELGRAIYFPFAVREEGFRPGSLLPPSFMTRAEVFIQKQDGSLVDFLTDELKDAIRSGDYRPYFSEFVVRFTRIIDSGDRVVVRTEMTEAEFKEYKKNDHYGYVFSGKSYEDARLVGIAPAYHSALGGILVDNECRTSDPDVFSIGESAMVYGKDRPIGGEHMAAVTLAPLLAQAIRRDFSEQGDMPPAVIHGETINVASLLQKIRVTLNKYDKQIVDRLVSASNAESSTLTESMSDQCFVRDIFSRLSWKITDRQLAHYLANIKQESIERVLTGYAFCNSPVQRALAKPDVLHRLALLSPAEYEALLDTIAARLALSEQVAPLKQDIGASIRDEEREEQVIRQNGQLAKESYESAVVEGFFRHFVLPCSFEVQHIYRSLHTEEKIEQPNKRQSG